MNSSLSLPIQDPSQAGEARRAVAEWARGRHWDAAMSGRVALVVTELGNNLALHTQGGCLLLRHLSEGELAGVEILSLDSGPGVANFNECLRDGFSTAGTSGTGLGAVRRTSHTFDAHSQPGVGTVLLSEIWGQPLPVSGNRRWRCGGINVPMRNETVSGDCWAAGPGAQGAFRMMIADGLGHGEFAATASMKAAAVFLQHPEMELAALLERMHDALRPTRGAALAVAEIDVVRRLVSYVGIGNIAASISTQHSNTSLVSMNGTIGVQYRACRLFTYPWPDEAVVVMASDGLRSQWQLSRYHGLLDRHPSVIAGVLYRDHVRGTDDATVIAVREAA